MKGPGSCIRFGRAAVYMNIFGILLSGLIFPVYSSIFHPQPVWETAELFIQAFHPVQTGTFFFGYFLITGSLLTFIALFCISNELPAMSGLVIHCIFAAVIFLNYIIQTTYVPHLAMNNPPEAEMLLAVFSMANPGSFAWALEMWGWGGIGLSYLFMAFIFSNNRHERILKVLFLANGTASLIAAFVTSFNMLWLFTPAGFAALIIWNLLVLVIDIFLLIFFRRAGKYTTQPL